MRPIVLQYGGDFLASIRRFEQGLGDTYYAQKQTVDAILELAEGTEQTCVLCVVTSRRYHEQVSPKVRVVAAGLSHSEYDGPRLRALVEQFGPTHVVLRYPADKLLRWGLRKRIPILPLFADSFEAARFRGRIRNRRLARRLDRPAFRVVANHGLSASRSLVDIGVSADKVVPYDYDPPVTPEHYPGKHLADGNGCWTLFYAGVLSEAKGVGDCIEAVRILAGRGRALRLVVAGAGQVQRFREQARDAGIGGLVDFLGQVEHDRVLSLMRESDAVVVPSRHAYPEAQPFTLCEAFCTRTPVVASDHAMFRRSVRHRETGMVFPSGDSASLADAVETVLTDADLYATISRNSGRAWRSLQLPVKWSEVLHRWLRDSDDDRRWFRSRSLAGHRYE